jgi:class 3 adenylate cyclase
MLSMTPPTRTVTLAFTDIEGSSALWERFGENCSESLDAHNGFIREQIAARGGNQFRAQGEASPS